MRNSAVSGAVTSLGQSAPRCCPLKIFHGRLSSKKILFSFSNLEGDCVSFSLSCLSSPWSFFPALQVD